MASMTLRDALRALGSEPGDAPDIVLLQRLQALIKQQTGGERTRYLRDVLQMPPEVVRVEHIRFETILTTAGGSNTAAALVKIPQGMDFVLKQVVGYSSERDTDQFPDNWGAISFNAREEGRNQDMFTSSIRMAELLSTFGPSRGLQFKDGIYRLSGGHSIEPTFTVDTSTDAAYRTTSNVKRFGVVMIGDLVLHPSEPRT